MKYRCGNEPHITVPIAGRESRVTRHFCCLDKQCQALARFPDKTISKTQNPVPGATAPHKKAIEGCIEIMVRITSAAHTVL